jgi:hypothetical protein
VPKYRVNQWEGGAQEIELLDSGGKFTLQTFTCAHCNRVIVIPPKAKPDEMGGFCRMEMKPVCIPCEKKGECTPFERKLEEMEARGRLLAAIG